jgi:HEAT repeat protein
MGKKLWIALAFVAVALVGGLIIRQSLQPREPIYQGKPLSWWLRPRYTMTIRASTAQEIEDTLKQREVANIVVRQIGTNAIPTLLGLLQAKDSPLKTKFFDLAAKQHIINFYYIPASEWNRAARDGFAQLGSSARNAVPALIKIANQKNSGTSQLYSISALGCIGPAAMEGVPSLLSWATNANVTLRISAIDSLGRIHSSPDQVIPVLLDRLSDPKLEVRLAAVLALSSFGPDAIRAVPALTALTHDPDRLIRNYANSALRVIDP